MRRLWAVYQGETKIATFDNKEGAKICQQRVGGEIVEMVEADVLEAKVAELRDAVEHYADCKTWHWNPEREAWEYNASGSAYFKGPPSWRTNPHPEQEVVDDECGRVARDALSVR